MTPDENDRLETLTRAVTNLTNKVVEFIGRVDLYSAQVQAYHSDFEAFRAKFIKLEERVQDTLPPLANGLGPDEHTPPQGYRP